MLRCSIVIDPVHFPCIMTGNILKLMSIKGVKLVGYEEGSIRFVVVKCSWLYCQIYSSKDFGEV
jgi:hypothetical protein